MRLAFVALLGLLAATALLAAPAAADVTVSHLPVYVCAGTVCSPCVDPVTVQEDFVSLVLTGAAC